MHSRSRSLRVADPPLPGPLLVPSVSSKGFPLVEGVSEAGLLAQSVEQDLTGGHRSETHGGLGQRGLSRPGLADQTDDGTVGQQQIDIVHGSKRVTALAELHGDAAELKRAHRCPSASRDGCGRRARTAGANTPPHARGPGRPATGPRHGTGPWRTGTGQRTRSRSGTRTDPAVGPRWSVVRRPGPRPYPERSRSAHEC